MNVKLFFAKFPAFDVLLMCFTVYFECDSCSFIFSKLCPILDDLYPQEMVARTHKVWVFMNLFLSIVWYCLQTLIFLYMLPYIPQFVSGNSQYRRGNDTRIVVPRRSWSDREEVVLVVAFVTPQPL